jgi:hypothetical protein
LQIKTKNVSSHTADSKPVKQEVNGTLILPPLAFPGMAFENTPAYYDTAKITAAKSFIV